jgi:hypothetical protein
MRCRWGTRCVVYTTCRASADVGKVSGSLNTISRTGDVDDVTGPLYTTSITVDAGGVPGPLNTTCRAVWDDDGLVISNSSFSW